MKEAGYAAVSSRKVERQAGLKSQLVHYYFGLWMISLPRCGSAMMIDFSKIKRAFWHRTAPSERCGSVALIQKRQH